MTRAQLTGLDGEFTGPYLPIGEYGPCPGHREMVMLASAIDWLAVSASMICC